MMNKDQADALVTQGIDTLFEQWWRAQSPPGTFDKEQCRVAFIAGFKAARDRQVIDEFLTLLAEVVEVNRKDG